MKLFNGILTMPDFGALEPVPANQIEQIRQEYDGVPADYVEFLSRVGFGNTSGDLPAFMFYSGLSSPSSIYDPESAAELQSILLFGDDYQGYCAGFDTANDWIVVEVNPINKETHEVAPTFSEFLRERFLAE